VDATCIVEYNHSGYPDIHLTLGSTAVSNAQLDLGTEVPYKLHHEDANSVLRESVYTGWRRETGKFEIIRKKRRKLNKTSFDPENVFYKSGNSLGITF
jgi:hypothetical protein